jgi:ribonuclease-3
VEFTRAAFTPRLCKLSTRAKTDLSPKKESESPTHDWLLAKLGVEVDPDLLVTALTHRSFAHENGGIPTNERLEFLGDAVLGMVTAAELYLACPQRPESELSQLRSSVVCNRSLAEVSRELGLGHFLLLGQGERLSGGSDKDSLLADAFEAIIGAVYLTHGVEAAADFIRTKLGTRLAEAEHEPTGTTADPKSRLIEWCAAAGLPAPEYVVTTSGPPHALHFTAQVTVNNVVGTGQGTMKRQAEGEAAAQVLAQLPASDDA